VLRPGQKTSAAPCRMPPCGFCPHYTVSEGKKQAPGASEEIVMKTFTPFLDNPDVLSYIYYKFVYRKGLDKNGWKRQTTPKSSHAQV
jgi:hypothetical protein